MTRPALPDAVTTVRVIAILRGLRREQSVEVARALAEAGVRAIEVTVDSPSAFEVISEIAGLGGVSAGAGTVLGVDEAERAVAAGATFLITPVVDTTVITWAAERGIPIMPGAMTPTEVSTAWSSGAAGVKLFPAGGLGTCLHGCHPRAAAAHPADPHGRHRRRRRAAVPRGRRGRGRARERAGRARRPGRGAPPGAGDPRADRTAPRERAGRGRDARRGAGRLRRAGGRPPRAGRHLRASYRRRRVQHRRRSLPPRAHHRVHRAGRRRRARTERHAGAARRRDRRTPRRPRGREADGHAAARAARGCRLRGRVRTHRFGGERALRGPRGRGGRHDRPCPLASRERRDTGALRELSRCGGAVR